MNIIEENKGLYSSTNSIPAICKLIDIIQHPSKFTSKINRVNVIELTLLSMFFIFLFVTRYSYHLVFHTSAELFAIIISVGIFFITLYSNSLSENNFIVFLGIGYFFISIIDAFHMFTYPGVSIIFEKGSQTIAVQFWIAARYITAFTLLGSLLLLYKKVNKFNSLAVFFFYLVFCFFIIYSIVKLKIFPQCYDMNNGLTQFKIVSEYIVAILLLIAAFLLFNLRRNMDFYLFFYMECHLISMAVSEILFTNLFSPLDWSNVWSHFIRVISYFFLYKAIIETGLKRPYTILFRKIDTIGNELDITSVRLKQEQYQHQMIEEMLVKNDKCYELIINNSSDAIIVTYKNKIIYANGRAAKIFGADKTGDLIARELLDFVHPKTAENVKQQFEKLHSKTSPATQYEYSIVSSNGTIVDVEAMSHFFLYNGKLSDISILKDISPRNQINKLKNDIADNEKVLNETKEYNRLLTEFFSNISHDLKTPLNVILGAIQVLDLPGNDNIPYNTMFRLNKYHKMMKQNCYRLVRLVNNLIDLSKFDSGYLKINLSNQNIVSIVEDISLSVVDYIENRGLTIIFDTDFEEKVIAIDVDKLERIILNLLSNSIKFTDSGGTIYVNVNDQGEKVVISVKDTGIGIPADKLPSIFDRFSQVDKTLTRNKEGSGIGLSLVKTLVEMHGGTVSISSVEGKGTEINIELPAVTVEGESDTAISNLGRNNIEKINIEFSDIYS
jgi:PAS domain S-box